MAAQLPFLSSVALAPGLLHSAARRLTRARCVAMAWAWGRVLRLPKPRAHSEGRRSCLQVHRGVVEVDIGWDWRMVAIPSSDT